MPRFWPAARRLGLGAMYRTLFKPSTNSRSWHRGLGPPVSGNREVVRQRLGRVRAVRGFDPDIRRVISSTR